MVEGVAVVGAGDTTHNISGRRNPHTTSHQECPLSPLAWVWAWVWVGVVVWVWRVRVPGYAVCPVSLVVPRVVAVTVVYVVLRPPGPVNTDPAQPLTTPHLPPAPRLPSPRDMAAHSWPTRPPQDCSRAGVPEGAG